MNARFLWVAASLFGATAFVHAAGTATFTWEPDAHAYRDIDVNGFGPENSLEVVQDGLQPVFTDLAKRYLADGEVLQVSVRDVDLAGDVQPWRRGLEDVRIVKSIYPPAINFDWKVVNAAGETVREGSENLRDMNFEFNARPVTMRRMFDYEEQMLRDWGRSTLRVQG